MHKNNNFFIDKNFFLQNLSNFVEKNMQRIDLLRKKLLSNNNQEILEALEEFEENNIFELIPDIFNLYFKCNDEIQKKILFLFREMKHNKAIPYYMNELISLQNIEQYPELIKICWENSLDYSKYMDFFLNLIFTQSYEISIEAMTVIEQNIHFLDEEQKKDLLHTILIKMIDIEDKKKPILELIKNSIIEHLS